MGTPEAMYQEDGKAVWKCELNSYGKVRNFQGQYRTDCPFRYQGQYEDGETGLYYNRFRYYSPEEGVYISQDPIRLAGGMNIYSYVHDTNGWVDIFGLVGCEIDWSRRRGDGDTSEQHVRKHEVDNGTKPKHGVFADDAIDTTNSAWDRVQSEGIEGTRQPNGNDIYVVPYMEAGLQGGSSGDASILNNVTIITEGGTNKIVTAFPS
jgi:RHS repeat-associated protein